MNADEHRLNELTEKILGCAFRVSNKMGCGFLEKCYENAMAIELRKAGLAFQQQAPINVLYDDEIVGVYVADIIVEGLVLIELKTVREFDEIHSAQCLNYLRATGLPVCLLLNFAKPKVEVKRFRNKPDWRASPFEDA
jgi:GxxExxY protein